MTRAALLLVSALVFGCGEDRLPALGQIVLHVDTDAPVPPPPGSLPGPDDPPALFDRLRLQVFRAGETAPCAGCSRELEVTERLFREREVSMGIVPEAGVELVAKLELFRAVAATSEGPLPGSALTATVRLPITDDEGKREVWVTLLVDELGTPRGSVDAPADADDGAPEKSRVGSWPGAARVPCSGAPGPSEVCIPGGAFWMGNPLVRGLAGATDADRLRIVVLSPYFLDRTEVTVHDVRTLGGFAGVPWSGDASGTEPADWCTYTLTTSPKDDLPVTCMSWAEAQAHCAKRGARLPSEAEHEFVAGAFESRLFPWGSAEPGCDDAVWGRGGFGLLKAHPDRCRADGSIGSQEPAASKPALDHVAVGEDSVLHLGGNVAEWALDRWSTQDEACWSAPGVYRDPVCDVTVATLEARRATRGGTFAFDAVFMAAAARGRELEVERSGVLGFRCARSVAP